MSSEPNTVHTAPLEERRGHPRRKVDDLAYVACGSDNGGILLDVGEGGLSFQGIATLTVGKIVEVKFVLPGLPIAIEASAEVVWAIDSLRGGGLRFVNLDSGARQQIRQWVSAGAVSLGRKAQPPPDAQPFIAPVPVVTPSAAPEALRAEALFAIPATLASESTVRDVADLSADSRGETGILPQVPKTIFTDGLRRIHTVAAAPPPQAVQREKPRADLRLAPDATPGIVLSTAPEHASRAMLYVLGAALGCLVLIVAGWFGFRAQQGSAAASASEGAAIARPDQSTDEGSRNFQVEVLDIHNRRLILSNDPSIASSGYGPAGGQKGGAQSFSAGSVSKPFAVASKPLAASAPEEVAVAPSRSLQDLTLKTPSQLNRPPGGAEPQEPAAAGVVSPVASLGAPFVSTELPSQPPPPQAPAVIVPPKSGLQPAVLVKRVEPVYSEVARQARASGVVQVRALIGTDGVPRSLRFVSGDARLAAPALEAIRLWRYRPAVLDGQAIETEVLVQVAFQLQP